MTRLIVGCLLLGTAIACSAAEPGEFRFSKDINRGDAKSENIVAVTLDSDVYAGTRRISRSPHLRQGRARSALPDGKEILRI